MARRRNTQKIPRKKTINTKYLKFTLTGILALAISFVVYDRTAYFLTHAGLFTVKKIVKAPSLQFLESHHLTRLKGANIFDIDLKTVQRRVQLQYPEINQLRVFRRFPDKIYVSAKERRPFAFLTIDAGKILIDKDGVIVSLNAPPDLQVPSINGVTLYKKTVLGMPLKRREVDVALEIIKAIQENDSLASLYVSSINVANLSEIYFHLSNDLKVIVDENRIYQKIRNLGIVLSQGNLNLKDINYIDLRFKEPVLGKK